jgi:hypothetical protein
MIVAITLSLTLSDPQVGFTLHEQCIFNLWRVNPLPETGSNNGLRSIIIFSAFSAPCRAIFGAFQPEFNL